MRRRSVLVLGLLAASGAFAAVFLPVVPWADSVVVWARGAGAPGAFVYAIAYALAAILFLPASVLTLGAGYLYGPVVGTLVVSPASVAGALGAFRGSLAGGAKEMIPGKLPQPGPWTAAPFLGGLAATVAVVITMTKIARRELSLSLRGYAR